MIHQAALARSGSSVPLRDQVNGLLVDMVNDAETIFRMAITASLLIFAAASAQGIVLEQPKPATSQPVIAVQAVATARILQGAQIRFVEGEISGDITSDAAPQVRRDLAGTLWVEFS